MDQSQQQLLQWLYDTAQGNREAFAKLYQASSGKLFSVSLHLLRRHDWAEDVLQDAFVRIWHNAADYHAEKGSVMSWMISITRYRALDLLKSRRVKWEHVDISEPANDQSTDEIPLGEVIGLAREKVKLDDCMSSLTDDHRVSIQLAYFNGLSHQEITEHTGSALGSVKSWIRRGLTQLKRCLEA
ncbi:sigma-70 family RNA polymerase sigma factor [Alishewanella sp. WH16-1]|uniref:sigma-70 family RNA polymerase sigma factor n=1 Tax=Alishewanella sp. WH16-1 TaxID=1651088 RepID=UPI0009EAFD22|nr:sigma-70 family RNA polymerase sigma factor [Alishewanella sp. WH16-1]